MRWSALRSGWPAAIAFLAVVLVAMIAIVPRLTSSTPAVSPSPTVALPASPPTPIETAPPAPSPATATATPLQPTFVNATLGYAIDLPNPWHRTDCGSFEPGEGPGRDALDLFTPIPDRLLSASSTGTHIDHVSVFARDNPQRLTPRQWEAAGHIGFSAGRTLEDVTFAARPVLLVAVRTDAETFLVVDGERMFEVAHLTVTSVATRPQREAIVRSFRFLSPDELRTARAAPTPTPPLSRTPEEVADALANGFANRDVATLARVITPKCMSLGVAQGGGTAMDETRYLEELRDRFARGLTVTVQPRPLTGERTGRPPTLHVRSTWREPGHADLDVDLMISPTGDTWYWRGTVTYLSPRQP